MGDSKATLSVPWLSSHCPVLFLSPQGADFVTPDRILANDAEQLRTVGLSRQKVISKNVNMAVRLEPSWEMLMYRLFHHASLVPVSRRPFRERGLYPRIT